MAAAMIVIQRRTRAGGRDETASSECASSPTDWNRSAASLLKHRSTMLTSGRDVGWERGQRVIEDGVRRFQRRGALERRGAGEHLVQHGAEGEEVGARIDGS